MQSIIIYRSILFTILSLFLVVGVSCSKQDNEHNSAPDVQQEETTANNNQEDPDKNPGNEKTPLDTTIYNSDKDLWGWNNGDYVVLKWNRKDYSRFRVYRKTDKSSEWKPAWSESISRNEFFDRDIQGFGKIEYKVEATDPEGQVLYTYDPLLFNSGN